jgi:crotonobetainyl-CoA:carnitine CoA-transferase CaiB-like acyl-CoA transferase
VASKAHSPAGPLDGVRVLDLSRVVSGPLCARILSDLGADVVKVEPPDGDVTRTVLPLVNGVSAYFAQMNAGKRNVSINMKSPGGPELVARLADACDVLIENFRPGVMDRLGLGADALLARNPGLVYCSVTGWGQDGPWRDRRAYAPLVHAQAGTLEMAGRLRGREPEQEVHVHGDTYPAVVAANAIVAALLQRSRTGVGQHLDVAMAEVLVYMNEWSSVELQAYGIDRQFDIWTHPVVRLADGTAVALVGNPTRQFATWVRALGGDPSLLDDERFSTPAALAEHLGECLDVLEELTERVSDYQALERALEPWPTLTAEVRSFAELAATPWAADRGLVTEVAPGLSVPTAPWRGSRTHIGVAGPPARRGEHNREVLAELAGLGEDDIDRLDAAGVLCRD